MIKTKSGFVAIVGPTNSGKSTFINAIFNKKISITSHKVQTTRTRIKAVKMFGDVQIIFFDTPGIFKPNRRLDRAMVGTALDSIGQTDAILLMIDAKKGITKTVKDIISKFKNLKNVFACLNKIDLVPKSNLLELAQELSSLYSFKEIFMISALKKDGIDSILKSLSSVMPESCYLFDPKDSIDIPDELYLSELTREKIYKYIHKELPYLINVITEKVDVDSDGILDIYQKVLVKSVSHKKILIGRGGDQLKKIGMEARFDIQNQWDVNARLHLFVKVDPKWEEDKENYILQGLDFVK